MMFVEGQSTGHVKLECLNETSYDGLETICGPDGKFIEVENQFTCGNTVPNCVQCGERGADAALCLFSTDAVKEDCAMFGNAITKSPNGPPPIPCVVEADCPIADDPYCGYHCFDETCAMWCEIAQQQCISESDCPIADDPYCGYSCLDGTCALYCVECNPEVDPNCCATMIPPSSFPPDDSTCWQWWTPPANGILSPGTPPPKGCDYQPCQDAVCACDSYCCDTAWDLSCRGYETAQGDMAENNYFVDGCSAMMLCCEPESAVPKPPIGGE